MNVPMNIANYDDDIQKAINNFIDEVRVRKESAIQDMRVLKSKLQKIDAELEEVKEELRGKGAI